MTFQARTARYHGASVRGVVHPQRRAHHHALHDRNYLPASIFGTAHEAGHGLYEQGVDPAYTRTTLATDLVGLYAVGGHELRGA